MRSLFRLVVRLVLALAVAAAVLLLPVAYVETACRGTPVADDRVPLVAPEWRRPEARTFLTYPEWHIVHAYDDYAEVIRTGDPHDFGFVRSITDFWGSLCALSETSAAHGGFPWETKQMVYTIGVSFTAEMLLKAAYEETVGRIMTLVRGPDRAPLDDLSARQAADYATFLQQVPWYRWDFAADADALQAAATDAPRDVERALALGLEYRAKAVYAKAIAAAVAAVGADALRLRAVVAGVPAEALAALPDVAVIATRPEGVEIETPRYRAFTDLAVTLADGGAGFVEIAGNDDILYTVISPEADMAGALHSFARQGNPGYRHLVAVKVGDLAAALRGMGDGATLEHIHDY